MLKCNTCKHSGSNMKLCKKCGGIWCQLCALKGKDGYPVQKAANICPYCGARGFITTAR